MTAALAPMWVTSRAAGITALVLAGLSVSLGLLLGGRLLSFRGRAAELRALHEVLALGTFAALFVHGAALLADPWLHPGLIGVLVPFAGAYRPLATGIGQIAALGLIGLGLTHYARRRIGPARWRRARRAIPIFWALAVVHGLTAGSDAMRPYYLLITLPVILAALALLAARWLRPAHSPA